MENYMRNTAAVAVLATVLGCATMSEHPGESDQLINKLTREGTARMLDECRDGGRIFYKTFEDVQLGDMFYDDVVLSYVQRDDVSYVEIALQHIPDNGGFSLRIFYDVWNGNGSPTNSVKSAYWKDVAVENLSFEDFFKVTTVNWGEEDPDPCEESLEEIGKAQAFVRRDNELFNAAINFALKTNW